MSGNTSPRVRRAVVTTCIVAMSTIAWPVLANVVNGSFESTIGRVTNNNGSGQLSTSANITGPATTPITLTNWNTTRDGIACVTFPNTYANGVCGPDRFSGSGFAAGGPGISPDGGNFVLIDGDRTVTTALYQTLTGLIVGQTYTVNFFQAGARFLDVGANGTTTERWDVSLGGTLANVDTTGNFIDGTHLLSTQMTTLAGSFSPWQSQTMMFQVIDPNLANGSITSQILAFFAVGSPQGQPPIVLLDGITVTGPRGGSVPEPATLALLASGLFGTLVTRRLRGRRA